MNSIGQPQPLDYRPTKAELVKSINDNLDAIKEIFLKLRNNNPQTNLTQSQESRRSEDAYEAMTRAQDIEKKLYKLFPPIYLNN